MQIVLGERSDRSECVGIDVEIGSINNIGYPPRFPGAVLGLRHQDIDLTEKHDVSYEALSFIGIDLTCDTMKSHRDYISREQFARIYGDRELQLLLHCIGKHKDKAFDAGTPEYEHRHEVFEEMLWPHHGTMEPWPKRALKSYLKR